MSKINRADDSIMTNPKLVLSVGLATAALALFLTNAIGGLGTVEVSRTRTCGSTWHDAIVLATAAFVVSWKQKSFLVSGLIRWRGHNLCDIWPDSIGKHELCNHRVPGSYPWSHTWAPIFGLGVAKGIRTVRPSVESSSYQ